MIRIEKAKKEHAAAIAHLIMVAMTDNCCLSFCGEGRGLGDFRQMMTLLAAREDSQYSWQNTFVALEDDKVVGIATSYDGGRLHELRKPFLELAKIWLNRDHTGMDEETQAGELYLDSLAVLPDYRRQGIATQLIEVTAQRASTLQLPCVGLLVDAGNPKAEHLYHACGFRFANPSNWGGHQMKHLVRPL